MSTQRQRMERRERLFVFSSISECFRSVSSFHDVINGWQLGGMRERSGKFNEISITKPKTVEACEREQTNGGGGKKNNVVVERRTKEEMARARRMDDDGEKKGKKSSFYVYTYELVTSDD